MADQVFPTKGNLLNIKKSLSLANLGYELMDRKRNILIREMMSLIDTAKKIRDEIEDTYKRAYDALQRANISMGISENVAYSVPVERSIEITYRSVMGVEIPHITMEATETEGVFYGLYVSNSQLDIAYICFNRCKEMTVVLAEMENSIYRLAVAIKKTQRRANALKNIIIPNFESTAAFISNALEEKEREEFSRLKVIRHTKERNEA
ncbi:V-type ATP synthase subunit D [Fumia xinanensis]|uniref:V-type ATP synthase subunit D n=1 Tax=Fumia xinanensis TaxID=2763659 RepID=A0A926I6L4_9FIRM|nr:V-type ATP synthase subunit D [Fumia xinanensis]PWL47706.1 MAG: V-type ATP synthase subunit D [Clostridiales bacterium]